jgi:hypothetical protein
VHIIHKIHVDYVDNFLQLLSTVRLWIKKRSFPQAIHIYLYMKKTCQKAGYVIYYMRREPLILVLNGQGGRCRA